MAAEPRPPTTGVSVVSLVCGVLGIVLFFIPTGAVVLGALAVVLGIIGFRRADFGTASGRGPAIAGVGLGAVTLAVAVVHRAGLGLHVPPKQRQEHGDPRATSVIQIPCNPDVEGTSTPGPLIVRLRAPTLVKAC